MRAIFGVVALLALAWGLSENRRAIPWRTVLGGVVLQIAFALVLILLPPSRIVLRGLDAVANALQTATETGTGFVFGYLGGGPMPFAEPFPGAAYILAFRALPLFLVISALASLFYYWGILQLVMRGFAAVLRRTLGIDGPLALGAATHIFVGMVEAPLIIRPYLARMQRGELFALMSCGMAGIAGTVMVIYATFLAHTLPDALGNILAASVISTPAAVAMGALMVPFDRRGADDDLSLALSGEDRPVSTMDAITRGTLDAIFPLASVIAMLVVLVALVSLVNAILAGLGLGVTLQHLFGFAFRPVMWLIGVPWDQAAAAGDLMGTKTALNEFVAYLDLSHLPPDALDPRSRMITVYALCGFANFGSLGIMLGGMGAMIPERRGELADLALRSLLSGTLATCSSGAIAGLLFPFA